MVLVKALAKDLARLLLRSHFMAVMHCVVLCCDVILVLCCAVTLVLWFFVFFWWIDVLWSSVLMRVVVFGIVKCCEFCWCDVLSFSMLWCVFFIMGDVIRCDVLVLWRVLVWVLQCVVTCGVVVRCTFWCYDVLLCLLMWCAVINLCCDELWSLFLWSVVSYGVVTCCDFLCWTHIVYIYI